MKTCIAGILLTAALIAFFSTAGYTEFTPRGTQIPGESYVVLPDENSEITRLVIRQSVESAESETQTAEAAAEVITEEVEEKNVDDMLLMFWHGAAAVIIGEMLALIAAVVWAIIKGKR